MQKIKIREVKPGEVIEGLWMIVRNTGTDPIWCIVAMDGEKEIPISGVISTEVLAQHEISQLIAGNPDEFELADEIPF